MTTNPTKPTTVALPRGSAIVILESQRIKTEIAKLKTEQEALDNRIRTHLVEHGVKEGTIGGKVVVVLAPHSRRSLAVKELRKDHPTLAEEYTHPITWEQLTYV